MKNKLLFTLASAILLSVCSCTSTQKDKGEKKDNPTPVKQEDDIVPVFVMSGQSNMEGSTNWRLNGKNLLKEYMDEADENYNIIENGIDNVVCSYYGYYYPNGWTQAHTASTDTSTPEARLTPNFQPTTVGMGVGDNNSGDYFGPELGMAYKLSQEYDGDEPIHLIKCAFSGSGFEKTDGATWKARPDDTKSAEDNAKASLYYLLIEIYR